MFLTVFFSLFSENFFVQVHDKNQSKFLIHLLGELMKLMTFVSLILTKSSDLDTEPLDSTFYKNFKEYQKRSFIFYNIYWFNT
jgi:hypothetical protein